MKRYKIIIAILSVFVLLAAYAIGYKYGIKSENENIVLREEVNNSNPAANSDEVSGTEGKVVLKDAIFVLENYDLDTGNVTASEKELPVEFVGMEREKIIEYISKNYDFFREKNEEIKSVMLLSFSEDRLVVRKSTQFKLDVITDEVAEESPYNYFMCIKNDYIVVYRKDRETVFMNTGISMEMIDEDSLLRLKEGIPVEDISTLYEYLENFTS